MLEVPHSDMPFRDISRDFMSEPSFIGKTRATRASEFKQDKELEHEKAVSARLREALERQEKALRAVQQEKEQWRESCEEA